MDRSPTMRKPASLAPKWALLSLVLLHLATLQASSAPQIWDRLFNLNSNNDTELPETNRCGYSSCPSTDPSRVNVHIIAHTHDDVGWLKTVDQYYYGTKKKFSMVGVQHILDSVMPQLAMDPEKRFIYVEMSFFAKWWEEQTDQMKSLVRRLVNEGRLEFINGGWCMNDEATVTYHSTIEQMTLGLRFLNESFGSCARPKVGWQIDPFGHTNEQASMFGQFGFDGMFFSRIGHDDKTRRTNSKSLDLVWHGDRILAGQSGSIFTNVFRDGYDSPDGYCFDVQCKDDNLVDNKRSFEYNMAEKGDKFISYLRTYASQKLTNQLLVPLGGDFQFSAASQNFKNIDKLIKYVRSKAPELNIFYSTPSCYQVAIHRALASKSSPRLPEKFDDFMPYDSSYAVWWSGFFSSRPSVKLIERATANLLQVSRLVSLANLVQLPQKAQEGSNNPARKSWIEQAREHEDRCLMQLWEVLGDLQHHDAVSGTEKQHVADDYVRRASIASTRCAAFMGELRRAKLESQLKKSAKLARLKESGQKYKLDSVYLGPTQLCPLLNISQCDPIESEVNPPEFLGEVSVANKLKARLSPTARAFPANADLPADLATKATLVNVYNPLARPISAHDIRLPCAGKCDLDKVKVIHLSTNETMKLIRLPAPAGVTRLPFRDAQTSFEVLFYANLPALGYISFVVEDTNNEAILDEEVEPSDSLVINDESFDAQKANTNGRGSLRSRRLRRSANKFDFFTLSSTHPDDQHERPKRDSNNASQLPEAADRVIVKFDLHKGVIVGLKREGDGAFLDVTQKFGWYESYAKATEHPGGAYIFRPNSTEPTILDKPISFKMYKRKSGALIEIHQKWADWLWQTIRVDAKKNYIEFDHLVGPVPLDDNAPGREVITRYISNMANDGVFMTDSNDRQLLPRQKFDSELPEQLGGSFYPVVSTILLRNNRNNSTRSGKRTAETIAVLVDRAQAGTSLNEGQMELLIHRRQTVDDDFGVGEALNEPGEDGRGLVTRGRHRLFLLFPERAGSAKEISGSKVKPLLIKLPETPKTNLTYQRYLSEDQMPQTGPLVPPTYVVHDPILDDIKQQSLKFMLQPVLTFDRLRVTASELVEMVWSDSGANKVRADLTLLNSSLPTNVHLLTLQPWTSADNQILIRLENLDNPLTVHPFPHYETYKNLLRGYNSTGNYFEAKSSDCPDRLRPTVEVNIEHLIKRIRFVSLDELALGANVLLKDSKRLDWTGEESQCSQSEPRPNSIKLGPRQIRTFLAKFEYL